MFVCFATMTYEGFAAKQNWFEKYYDKNPVVRFLVGTVTGYSVPLVVLGSLTAILSKAEWGIKPLLIGGTALALSTFPLRKTKKKWSISFGGGSIVGGTLGLSTFILHL